MPKEDTKTETSKKDTSSKKKNLPTKTAIEEIDLDSLDIELDLEDETKTNLDDIPEPSVEDLQEVEEILPDDQEDAIESLKKEKGLKKMPVERSEDKRRVGKGLQKFIDNEVDPEMLEDMPEEVQELMKK